jgi:hypothetical protein
MILMRETRGDGLEPHTGCEMRRLFRGQMVTLHAYSI